MKKTHLILFSVATLFSTIGCHSVATKTATAAHSSSPEANLTQAEAEARAQTVSKVKYQLKISLDQSQQTFGGHALVTFKLKKPARNLFLDFQNGASVETASLNGKRFEATPIGHRIALPEADLLAGDNSVEIQYRQAYSNEGRGLHRFQDPEDQRVYLYTQFEANDAHQMFPCFDQPDIKATVKLTVVAPKAWEVITTMRETSRQTEGDVATWTFPETPRMSSYLFSLHAGPYAKWQSIAGTIPLRLFARQSLKKYVHAKDWFTPTREGLKFYGKY